jgi:hypothetical protein
MSSRQDKKLRKFMRKTYQAKVERIAEKYTGLIKPKPVWLPNFLWMAALKLFIITEHIN